jgi:hypothetical protein
MLKYTYARKFPHNFKVVHQEKKNPFELCQDAENNFELIE